VSQYGQSGVSSFNVRIRSFHAWLVLQVGALASQGGNSTARKVGQIIARGDRRWLIRFADAKNLQYADNRALDIPCYNPEYTFVEKVPGCGSTIRSVQSDREDPNEFPETLLRHPPTARSRSRAEIQQNRWMKMGCVNIHTGKKYKMVDCTKEKNPTYNVVLPSQFARLLIEYQEHPEAKSLAS
jgi:hypothetical protein